MKDILTYKGYIGTVHFSAEDDVFYGKIEGIRDLVSFEGQSVDELKKAFQEAVEDYLEFCKQIGKRPEKSYKGSFNIRISPEIHRQAIINLPAAETAGYLKVSPPLRGRGVLDTLRSQPQGCSLDLFRALYMCSLDNKTCRDMQK